MNAEQARKLSQTNRDRKDEHEKIKKRDVYNADFNLLYEHLKEKVEESVKHGKFSVDNIKFDQDRFPETIISDVGQAFRKDGFTMSVERHQAYKIIHFTISWS